MYGSWGPWTGEGAIIGLVCKPLPRIPRLQALGSLGLFSDIGDVPAIPKHRAKKPFTQVARSDSDVSCTQCFRKTESLQMKLPTDKFQSHPEFRVYYLRDCVVQIPSCIVPPKISEAWMPWMSSYHPEMRQPCTPDRAGSSSSVFSSFWWGYLLQYGIHSSKDCLRLHHGNPNN